MIVPPNRAARVLVTLYMVGRWVFASKMASEMATRGRRQHPGAMVAPLPFALSPGLLEIPVPDIQTQELQDDQVAAGG